jgi:hypothetical protein
LLECFPRQPPFGDVTRDCCEADQLAVIAANSVDDDVGPEARASEHACPLAQIGLPPSRSHNAAAGSPEEMMHKFAKLGAIGPERE